MTTERATKAVNRLEAIGMFDYECMKNLEKEIMIRRFEEMDESQIKPEFIQFLDMSDFKFGLFMPIGKAIMHTVMKQQKKTIEKNLERMRATM